MKFYHVCHNSLKEQHGTVTDLIVVFSTVIFLSGSCLACKFDDFVPYTTNYGQPIDTLRTHLPTDYNFTVFLLDRAIQDSCCVELQAMLEFKRAIGHLRHHSLDPLQEMTSAVLTELQFLKDCPTGESSSCKTVRMSSLHLLQDLMQQFRSLDAKYEQNVCNFGQCTLYTCRPGLVGTTLATVTDAVTPLLESGISTNGTHESMAGAAPTSPSPASIQGNLTNQSMPSTSSSLTNRTGNANPTLANGRPADVNLTSLIPPLTSTHFGGLTIGATPIPVPSNGGRATATNWTDATPLIYPDDAKMAATLGCNTEPSPIIAPFATQTVVIILVTSIIVNVFLLGCLIKRNRRLAPPHMTELEPLPLARVEISET